MFLPLTTATTSAEGTAQDRMKWFINIQLVVVMWLISLLFFLPKQWWQGKQENKYI